MHYRSAMLCFALLLTGACAVPSQAFPATDRHVVFPEDANVVDVTKAPYNAKGDGKTDDTAAIQKALDDHPSANRIIYLPEGTYLISDTLKWGSGAHGGVAQKRTIMQGAGMDRTTIRLKDNCPGYESYEMANAVAPKPGKAMIWTGNKPAQRFRNGIRDLTVSVGNGNPGATAVQYIANNQGSMRHVRIRTEDGQGAIGLDLGYTGEQGPCLIYNLIVEGFDFGIRASAPVNSITMEYVRLRNQKRVGLLNDGQCISIRHLRFEGAVTAIALHGPSVVAAMEHIDLQGTGDAKDKPAILCDRAYLYVRDLKTSGYKTAIENTLAGGDDARHLAGPNGPSVADWVSHQPESLFPSATTHLRLPVKETPQAPLLPLSEWVSPLAFGGNPDEDVDHTEAIQKAIDSGKRVVYLPHGSKGWRIDGKVILRGNVEVFTPLEGTIRGEGTIELGDGRAPTVWIDRLNMLYQHVGIRHASKRTLVISGTTFGRGGYEHAGTGDLFTEDVVMGRLVIPRGVNFWARQLNIEHKGDQHPEAPEKLVNDGGSVYILGYKTEMAGSVCLTRKGGTTMIFGGMIYAQGKPKKQPMLIVEDGRLSATLGEVSWNFGAQGFHVAVRETRAGETRELPGGAKAGRYWHSNHATALPLFVAGEP